MKLSIVVPVWNRAKMVRRTLDSIAASVHRGFELLIVDNGSTDDSLAVCERWAWEHRDDGFPIRVLTELQHGASIARNRGLQECRTEYIYFFDSDDLFSNDFIAKVLPVLDGEVDVVCVPVRQEVNDCTKPRPFSACSDAYVHVLNSMLSTQSMVLRADYLRRIGAWNENLTTWDDWELGVRVLLGKPRLLWLKDAAFHQVIVHAESQTGSSFSATLEPILVAMRAVKRDINMVSSVKDQERRRLRNALYLRSKIMSGKLAHERNKEGYSLFRDFAKECASHPGIWLRGWGELLAWYTAIGGRGAWRIALSLVR